MRSEFAASEKGKVKDGEGLLEALITGQIGSLHFVSIAKQWIAVSQVSRLSPSRMMAFEHRPTGRL